MADKSEEDKTVPVDTTIQEEKEKTEDISGESKDVVDSTETTQDQTENVANDDQQPNEGEDESVDKNTNDNPVNEPVSIIDVDINDAEHDDNQVNDEPVDADNEMSNTENIINENEAKTNENEPKTNENEPKTNGTEDNTNDTEDNTNGTDINVNTVENVNNDVGGDDQLHSDAVEDRVKEQVEGEVPDTEKTEGNEPSEVEKTTIEEDDKTGDVDQQADVSGETVNIEPNTENADVPKEENTEELVENSDVTTKPDDNNEDTTSKSPVQQSDTFTEGDRPESPVQQTVGEKLSRGPTPTIEESSKEDTQTELIVPGTPERPDSATDDNIQTHDEEEDLSPEPQFDREALIEKYNAALAEREQLKQQNYQLQHKLAEYFRKKKSDDRTDYDKNVADQEQRYLKYMDQLQELQKQARREKENYKLQINDLEEKCKERKKKVDEEREKFTQFKQVVALNALNSRSGKPIPPKDIEQYLINEEKKENEVVNVRLENIKSKNKLKKKEQQLKSKEELAEGLHLIDFEQLKIENQTYNEKIEERNEELLKLRKKITSTVQVLTHLKEKLQFVQAENQVQKQNLYEVESSVGKRRDILSKTKQARDALRIDNQKLRQKCGLLGNESLLRDFEERKDESDDLKIKLEELRLQHAELALNCNQVRKKIEQSRMGQV